MVVGDFVILQTVCESLCICLTVTVHQAHTCVYNVNLNVPCVTVYVGVYIQVLTVCILCV